MKIRTSKRPNSLFGQYLYISIICMMVVMVVLFAIFEVFITRYKTQERINSLNENVANIAESIEQIANGSPDNEDLTNSILIIANMLNISSASIEADVFVADADGTILFCKDQVDNNLVLVNKDVCDEHQAFTVPQTIRDATSVEGNYAITKLEGLSKGRQIVVGRAIEQGGNVLGYVYAAAPISTAVSAFAEQIGLLFLGAAVVAFFVVFAMAYLLAKKQAAPLQEMSRLTKQYAKGDFSERMEVEGEDELAELAQSLNQMAGSLAIIEESRSSFVANVSHELKTPMTSISGFIDGILDGTIPAKDEKKYLRIVTKEVKRLATLVVTMLTLSKIEAGEEQLKFSSTDMRQTLIQALLSFEQPIEEAGYSVEGLDTLPDIRLMADGQMLYQVAYNLFDNAVKFTNSGGTIRVDMTEEEDRVLVAVSNTGKGIPEEELSRVFERFYKLDKSRSEHVKGVGLGLNLARNIVHLHGGELTAKSVPDEYTTFTFWIPKDLTASQ